MKRPSIDDMNLASEWLDVNDGGDGEAEACKRVAAWLEASVRESMERDAARKVGVPVKALRDRVTSNRARDNACEAIAISSDPDFRCVHCGKASSAHRHQSRVASTNDAAGEPNRGLVT